MSGVARPASCFIRLTYRGCLDSEAPQSAGLNLSAASSRSDGRKPGLTSIPELESFTRTSGLSIDDFWQEADGLGLAKAELAQALLTIGARYNYGLPPGVEAGRAQIAAFWRSLQLRELALAQACALGREKAWRQLLERYREPLTQAAIGITGSASLGQDLADSLYAEMFGLPGRDGERRSPLASYAGRGSLMGFLRATLAQRHVDQHRRTHRETTLDGKDFAAESTAPSLPPEVLVRLGTALTATLSSLESEDRFILSAWFLDQRPLREIAGVLRVHEATVSRKIKRLTERLRKQLVNRLRAAGMSRHAAEEALGADPRDLTINLRSLLQTPPPAAFYRQGALPEPEQA